MDLHVVTTQRVAGLEERVSEIERTMKDVKANLLGTFDKPGTLDLMRRNAETTMELKDSIDCLRDDVNSLRESKTHLKGWFTGACFMGGILFSWLGSWAVKALMK